MLFEAHSRLTAGSLGTIPFDRQNFTLRGVVPHEYCTHVHLRTTLELKLVASAHPPTSTAILQVVLAAIGPKK